MRQQKNIRVLHLNESIRASSVPFRLLTAMHNNGFESTILTAHSDVDETDIVVVKKSIPERLFMKLDWHYTQWRLRH